MVATPAARLAGFVMTTVGLVASDAAPVTKVHAKLLARGTWARLLAPVVIVPVNLVLGANEPPIGAKTAILFVAS